MNHPTAKDLEDFVRSQKAQSLTTQIVDEFLFLEDWQASFDLLYLLNRYNKWKHTSFSKKRLEKEKSFQVALYGQFPSTRKTARVYWAQLSRSTEPYNLGHSWRAILFADISSITRVRGF